MLIPVYLSAQVSTGLSSSHLVADRKVQWVDSVYQSLTLSQRIGQLYMVAAYSGGEKYNRTQIDSLIQYQGIGGVIFMQGTPEAQINLTNRYQQQSKVPLLVAMDAEWGLGMRLTGVRDLPFPLMLGASADSNLVYRVASAIAAQCRRMGVHINFAPVADINNNPDNPVINFRSFGERKEKVTQYAIQYMRGLQENGIMACAKHFPGHGNTDIDSHNDLPTIQKTRTELDNMEWVPFRKLIESGIQAVMMAHLQVPALDPRPNTPGTISEPIVEGVLRKSLGFQGLIFTDALNMKGVAQFYPPGEIDLKAFLAGNDVLLFSQDVPEGILKIKEALRSGLLTHERLEQSVKKILAAKYDAGLFRTDTLKPDGVLADLNALIPSLRQQVASAAITLLRDPYLTLDRIRTRPEKVTYIGVGKGEPTVLSEELKKSGINDIRFAPTRSGRETRRFLRKLPKDHVLIIGVHDMSRYPARQFGLDETELNIIQELQQYPGMLVMLGNPYAMKYFCGTSSGVIITYDEATETQEVAARIITGNTKAMGTLPVKVCSDARAGDGIVSLTGKLGEILDSARFARQVRETDIASKPAEVLPVTEDGLECCVSPEAVESNVLVLSQIDEIIQSAIAQGAFPGCRILAAKKGRVFYDKSFGFLDETKKDAVDYSTVYDLASVTKAAATTLAIMRLYEQGKINLDETLGHYLPVCRGTNKAGLSIRNILLHQAGLKSWIPFYKETLDSTGKPRADIYSKFDAHPFTIKVTRELYMRRDWVDTLWKRILDSPLENTGRYVYSDLDFLLLQKVIEEISGKNLSEYMSQTFYKPLGLKFTHFQPRKGMPMAKVAPTEKDNYFRHQTIVGYVHDMGAAMLGGIAGHAGLFSTANDVAVIFQMILNKGVYRGQRYFKQSTIDLFTSRQSGISRRALGFDKPETGSKGSPCAQEVSPRTFGHQGFTGTCVWADPAHDLLFVFLSNRTYPNADNSLIRKLNIRERCQSIIYQSLGIASRVPR